MTACGFCHLGTVPATGRGSDGFEPCPYCDGTGVMQEGDVAEGPSPEAST